MGFALFGGSNWNLGVQQGAANKKRPPVMKILSQDGAQGPLIFGARRDPRRALRGRRP